MALALKDNITLSLRAQVIYSSDGDPRNEGRVQVYIPALHRELKDELIGPDETYPESEGDLMPKYPWATILTSDGEPPLGSVVLVSFEGNDINFPVIIGVYNAGDFYSAGDITGDGYSGGTLAELAANVIFGNEGNYTSVNWNDNGSISLGKIQWNANAGRAKPLMQRIRGANESKFDNICKKNGATQLILEVTGTNSWYGYKNWSSSCPIGKAILEILATDESKKIQDMQALEDVQVYLDHAKTAGITNPECMIYYADIENQWGSGGAAAILNKKWDNLDLMHAAALIMKYGQYASRRKNTYNKIKELKSQGKLEPNQLMTIRGSLQGEIFFLWPSEATNITSKFGPRSYYYNGKLVHDNHNGIDIGANGGTPISCAYPGKVVVSRYDSSYGNYCVVQGDNYATLYAHMRELPAVHIGDTVDYGTYLGPVGTTGSSTGYHLHFSIFEGTFEGNYGGNNGKFIDPLTLISSSNTRDILEEKIRKAEEDKKKKEEITLGKVKSVVKNAFESINSFKRV